MAQILRIELARCVAAFVNLLHVPLLLMLFSANFNRCKPLVFGCELRKTTCFDNTALSI
jgi:hypothetical protein